MIGKAIMRRFVFVTPDDQISNSTGQTLAAIARRLNVRFGSLAYM
jgi:hypothetical protein